MTPDAAPVTAPADAPFAAPLDAAPSALADAPAAASDALVEQVGSDAGVLVPVAVAPFSSLYDSLAGTLAAIGFGLAFVCVVQVLVNRIFARAQTMIEALTFFATSMVAFLVAVYLCDLLIAGPDILLLRDGERSSIVSFVQDICLMVFAYFFGTKSADAPSTPSE